MNTPSSEAAPYVLVGVDGSPNCIKAIRAAVQQAAWRGIAVHAVSAWTYPAMYGMEGAAYSIEPSTLEASALAVLEDALAVACPDPAERSLIKRFAVGGSPAEALIAESKNAELLVVGARGHGGFLGLLVGSVASQVVKHAHCPVLVVPPDNA